MAYIVDPTDPTQPTGDKGATQGDDELRALKAYIATLIGAGGPGLSVNIFRKNAIIGGDFDTNPWQRGTVFVGVVTNSYTADRWQRQKAGTMIEDVVEQVDAPVIGTVYKNKTMDSVAINCLQANVTTAEAALGVNDFSYYTQIIEGFNFKNIAQVPMVLSFWHKHTKPGIYCISLINGGFDRSYVTEYTQVVADTWEFEQIAIPASPAAGTWAYGNTAGLQVNFIRGAGVNFQTPAGVWTVGNFLASANQVNSLDTIGNKFRITLIQLEAGTLASKFERRSIEEELLLCERYFEKSFPVGSAPAQVFGLATGEERIGVIAAGAVAIRYPITNFRVRKRIAPAIAFFNPSATNAQARDITTATDCTATGTTGITDARFQISAVQPAGSAINDVVGVHWTANAEL